MPVTQEPYVTASHVLARVDPGDTAEVELRGSGFQPEGLRRVVDASSSSALRVEVVVPGEAGWTVGVWFAQPYDSVMIEVSPSLNGGTLLVRARNLDAAVSVDVHVGQRYLLA